MRAHAQLIHEEGGRAAQNSTMLLTCLKNSITTTVYTKVYLQKPRYAITLIRKPKNIEIEDGICFLKVVNTRSSTVGVRKQIAHLDVYMRDVAKGDVSNLCAHTRSLFNQIMVVKLIHYIVNTNKQNHQFYGKSQLCPCCQISEETLPHLLSCESPGSAQHCTKALLELSQSHSHSTGGSGCSDP